MAVFDRGDIVRVGLDPVVGNEMRGESRPALVLTTKDFNRLGDVLVAPITRGDDYVPLRGFRGLADWYGLQNAGSCFG